MKLGPLAKEFMPPGPMAAAFIDVNSAGTDLEVHNHIRRYESRPLRKAPSTIEAAATAIVVTLSFVMKRRTKNEPRLAAFGRHW